MSDSPDLTTYAARVAPHIDRLFVAGHQAARPYVRDVTKKLRIRSFGLLIDLRRPLLCPGGVSVDDAKVIDRYVDPDMIVSALKRHVAEGQLQWKNRSCVPTSHGHVLLTRLTDALSAGASLRWTDAELVSRACELLECIVQQAIGRCDANSTPAFTAQRPVCPPTRADPPFHLWDRSLLLRYLRADFHAEAWGDAGLSVGQAGALHELWHAVGPYTAINGLDTFNRDRPSLRLLQQRGLADLVDDSWVITVEGRTAREHIEHRTNAAMGVTFGALGTAERDELLDLLSSLP